MIIEYLEPSGKNKLPFTSRTTLNKTEIPMVIYLHDSGNNVFNNKPSKEVTLAHYVLKIIKENGTINRGLKKIQPEYILISAYGYNSERVLMWFLGFPEKDLVLNEESDVFVTEGKIYLPLHYVDSEIKIICKNTFKVLEKEIKYRIKTKNMQEFLSKRPKIAGLKAINGVYTRDINL